MCHMTPFRERLLNTSDEPCDFIALAFHAARAPATSPAAPSSSEDQNYEQHRGHGAIGTGECKRRGQALAGSDNPENADDPRKRPSLNLVSTTLQDGRLDRDSLTYTPKKCLACTSEDYIKAHRKSSSVETPKPTNEEVRVATKERDISRVLAAEYPRDRDTCGEEIAERDEKERGCHSKSGFHEQPSCTRNVRTLAVNISDHGGVSRSGSLTAVRDNERRTTQRLSNSTASSPNFTSSEIAFEDEGLKHRQGTLAGQEESDNMHSARDSCGENRRSPSTREDFISPQDCRRKVVACDNRYFKQFPVETSRTQATPFSCIRSPLGKRQPHISAPERTRVDIVLSDDDETRRRDTGRRVLPRQSTRKTKRKKDGVFPRPNGAQFDALVSSGCLDKHLWSEERKHETAFRKLRHEYDFREVKVRSLLKPRKKLRSFRFPR